MSSLQTFIIVTKYVAIKVIGFILCRYKRNHLLSDFVNIVIMSYLRAF